MKNKKYELLKKFENKWIALDKANSKVLASGSTIADVEKNLKRLERNLL